MYSTRVKKLTLFPYEQDIIGFLMI